MLKKLPSKVHAQKENKYPFCCNRKMNITTSMIAYDMFKKVPLLLSWFKDMLKTKEI